MKRGKLKRKAKTVAVDFETQPESKEPIVAFAAPKRAPFAFAVTEHAITRLRRGHVVRHDGVEHVVTKVNQSCARIAPLHAAGTETVQFTPRFAEKPVAFKVPIKHTVQSISANSECEILRKLTPQQMESRGFK